MAELDLVKIGTMAARQIEAIKRYQAEQVFPGSRLAKSIRVTARVSERGIGFSTVSVPYGRYQDKGTYGRRRKTGVFNPNPPRRGRAKTWSPSGIAPSFWNTLSEAARSAIKKAINKALMAYIKASFPTKITLKVR
jgi:hypothetical protein